MKILLITCKPPYPTIDGGCFATKRLIDTLLSQGNEVKLLTIATQKHPFQAEVHPSELQTEAVTIDTSLSILDAIKHLFKSSSYNVERFREERLKNVILKTLTNAHFDSVIFDSLFSTPYLASVKQHFNGNIFLRAHNVESDIWKQKANSARGIKGLYLKKLANDLLNYEQKIIQKVTAVLTITQEDEKRFSELNNSIKAQTIPIPIEATTPINYEVNQPFFIGGMDWEPNFQAVEKAIKIIEEIGDKSIQLQLAGKGTEQFNESSFVKIHGRVDSALSFMKKNGFLLAPIMSGSGVRVKVLEAMSAGIPVLTTKLGAAGVDKNALLIGKNDSEIKKMIVQLSKNKDFRQKTGENGQKFIKSELKIEGIGKKLQKLLNG